MNSSYFSQYINIVYRSLLDAAEVKKLRTTLESDTELLKHSYTRDDGHGRKSRMALWNHPGKDISGMIARSEKVAGTMEKVRKEKASIKYH